MNINEMQKTIISRTRLLSFLEEHSLVLKKRFGQNFIHDRNIIDKITASLECQNKNMIEIGPGIGNVTLFYYTQPASITLIEIDKGFFRILEELFKDETRIRLIHNDILKTVPALFPEEKKKYIFFSNLPYNIASQVLFSLISCYSQIDRLYIMLPDIFIEKLIVPDGVYKNKLGLLLNIYFKIEKLFKIKRSSFFPVPEVDSVFLKLTPCGQYLNQINDPGKIQPLLTLLFNQKRKILKSALQKLNNDLLPGKFSHKRIDELNINDIIEIINNSGRGAQ